MTFAVIWKLDAIHQLAQTAANSADPDAVRAAASLIDRLLRRMPRDLGESRDPGHRLWYEDVLGVYYRIDEVEMKVEVIYAGPSRRR